jgi:hypothetical protein
VIPAVFACLYLLSSTVEEPLHREAWREEYRDDAKPESLDATAVDSAGNFLWGGVFVGARNDNDIVIAKRDPFGKKLWEERFDITGRNLQDTISLLLVDGKDDVYAILSTPVSGRPDLAVVKLNGATGKREFTRVLSRPFQQNIYDAKFDRAGGIIFAGGSGSNGRENICVGRIKPDGTLDWVKDWNNGVRGDREAFGLEISAQGDLTLVGYTASSEAGGEAVALRYSATGELRWAKEFGGGNGRANDNARVVMSDPATGDPIIAGIEYSQRNRSDLYVTRLSGATGAPVWKTPFPEHRDATVTAGVMTETGPVFAATASTGNTGQDFWVVKVDMRGGVAWKTVLNSAERREDSDANLTQDRYGRLYLTGTSGVGGTPASLFAAALDPGGSVVWSEMLSESAIGSFAANPTVAWRSGHAVFGGLRGSSRNSDALLVCVAQAPIAVSRSFTVIQGETLTIGEASGLVQGAIYSQFATLDSAKLTGVGTFTSKEDGSFTYQAPGDFKGVVTVSYTLVREGLRPSTATATITVVEKPKR